MDLRHLRSFITLAENLHFARSAEQLGLSPPTLTTQIQELEHLLQAKLFNRTKRTVALTPAGDAFLVEARATLEQLDRAIHVGRRAGRGQVGKVEIGYVGSASFFGVLQDQVGRFRAKWPNVMVDTKEFPTEQLTPLPEEGRIDAAFVRTPVVLPPSIASHVLARDRFCLALAADHPLAQERNNIRSRALANEMFVVPEQGLGLRSGPTREIQSSHRLCSRDPSCGADSRRAGCGDCRRPYYLDPGHTNTERSLPRDCRTCHRIRGRSIVPAT